MLLDSLNGSTNVITNSSLLFNNELFSSFNNEFFSSITNSLSLTVAVGNEVATHNFPRYPSTSGEQWLLLFGGVLLRLVEQPTAYFQTYG